MISPQASFPSHYLDEVISKKHSGTTSLSLLQVIGARRQELGMKGT